MPLRMYDFKCGTCGLIVEGLEPVGTEEITGQVCAVQCNRLCTLKRIVSPTKRIDIDREAPKYIPNHVRRARALGHDGGTSKTEGQYDSESREGYKKKIMVGPK